jgi:hypothetical protein
VTNIEMIFFITIEDESHAVRGGWPMTVMLIQCFDFGSRGEATV